MALFQCLQHGEASHAHLVVSVVFRQPSHIAQRARNNNSDIRSLPVQQGARNGCTATGNTVSSLAECLCKAAPRRRFAELPLAADRNITNDLPFFWGFIL